MQDLRNRAAHHEPLVGGFPLNGQKDRHGNPMRLSVRQGHEAYLRLAQMIDRDLGAWLTNNSTVPALLAAKPPTAPPATPLASAEARGPRWLRRLFTPRH
jgi:hypothetical protein